VSDRSRVMLSLELVGVPDDDITDAELAQLERACRRRLLEEAGEFCSGVTVSSYLELVDLAAADGVAQ
jgi:hypothetical protein